ncbi:hypothetical protein [Dongia sedimenti]|uniref:Uncharacterized protein n=1 Tax=Dongia sedimenti TaxID=3064282 RepID=A0ABU0YHK8_9PROT|nr:hypothetical protein [Rhodospirillaceae bacterium R-7]
MSMIEAASVRLSTILCGLAVALLASAPASADPFSPAKSKATLTVTYTLKGGGTDRPESHEREVIWSVDEHYEITATMVAEKPSGFGSFHKPDAAEQAGMAQRQAAAEAGAQNMQSMMEMAQAIMAKCGEDEACIQQETIKMSQQIDPNDPKLKATKQNIETASAMPGDRYQVFSAGPQTGTYTIAGKAHEAYFDAACSLKNQTPCAFDSTVSGTGRLTDGNGNTSMMTGALAEIDSQSGSLVFQIPRPGIAAAKRTVTSKNPEVKTGTFDEIRTLKAEKLYGEQITVSCGACRSASGTITRDVEDEFLGRPAKLVIDWKFSRP